MCGIFPPVAVFIITASFLGLLRPRVFISACVCSLNHSGVELQKVGVLKYKYVHMLALFPSSPSFSPSLTHTHNCSQAHLFSVVVVKLACGLQDTSQCTER